MGSSQKALFFCSLLLLAVPILFFSSPSNAEDAAKKVNLTVYYESLCRYCSEFTSNKLVRVFTDGLLPIVHLRLVPWGNAKVKPDGSFECQHGEEECLLNTIEACTISAYPDVERHFPFIRCIDRLYRIPSYSTSVSPPKSTKHFQNILHRRSCIRQWGGAH